MKTKMKFNLPALLMLLALVCCASCSDDDEKTSPTGVSGPEAIATFKSYFYKDGHVNASRLEDFSATEWAVATDNNARACEVFIDITGLEAPLTGAFDYTYASPDGKCRIRLAGSAESDADAVYATFYIQIPECPEITKIHVADPSYFEGTNAGGDMATPGVPVIL